MSTGNWRNRRPLFYTPRPVAPPSRHGSGLFGKFLRAAGRGLRRTCTALGAFILFLSTLGALSLFGILEDNGPAALPGKMILLMRLDGDLPEKPGRPGLGNQFGLQQASIHQTIDALDKAGTDPRIGSFVVSLRGGGLSLTKIQELRAAVRRFEDAGKPAYIYADDYTQGMGAYYLASAFDEIWMQPVGSVMIPGIYLEMPFLRGLLDKVGVEPEVMQRKEYKTFFETATNTSMSEPNREMMASVLEDLGGQILAAAAEGRAMPPADFKALIDRGLFTDREALAAGLIDRLDYGDVLLREIREALNDDPDDPAYQLVDINDYAPAAARENASRSSGGLPHPALPQIAVVYITGAIMPGETKSAAPSAPAFMGGEIAAANDISAAIDEAGENPDIKAILIRIDSPGGSPTASETIRRSIVRAKQEGKPVIVSMGGAAASGGYWVASPADTIFALPATFTGSIGVVHGKFILTGLWDKIGASWDSLQWGENASLMSFNKSYSEAEAERMNAMLDSVYDGFLERVAEGRRMSVAQVDRIARGRVWTGNQARGNGLVDELGGMTDALDFAAVKAGAKDRTGISVVVLPRPRTVFEELVDLLENQVRAGREIGVLAETAGWFRPYLEQARAASARSQDLATYAPAPAIQ